MCQFARNPMGTKQPLIKKQEKVMYLKKKKTPNQNIKTQAVGS